MAEAEQIDSIRGPLTLALSQSVSRAASGQHLQLTNAAQGEFKAFYTEIAINKTGALIALPLQFADLFNGSENMTRHRLDAAASSWVWPTKFLMT